VTEIPEHLLKRSRDRRAALGGGSAGDDSGAAAPAATPATTSSAPPAAASSAPAGRAAVSVPAAPPPPKPDSAVVAAYKRRKRIPGWAMMALSLLPVWAFMYARAVTTQAKEVAGPLGIGAGVYSANCASCHGSDGGGGVGYKLSDGEVLKTFPHIEDQLRWVYYATASYNTAGIEVAGDPNRDGGPHVVGAKGQMGAQGSGAGGALTDVELLAVVCDERYTLGGADPTGDFLTEYETWCSEGSEIFADLEGGGDIRTLSERFPDTMAIGNVPIAGSPAGA
jgi:hypothetical protein